MQRFLQNLKQTPQNWGISGTQEAATATTDVNAVGFFPLDYTIQPHISESKAFKCLQKKGRSLTTSTAPLLVLKSLPMKDKRLLCSLASALRGSSWQSNLNHLNPKEQQLTLMRVRSSGPCLPWPLPHSLMGFFILLFSGH